ncbi:hypothetical protein CHU95_01605 [Niveispirillum lacus]|uniref:PepSY domain-containing protein n=1 Tax=Niveispirillum lacus TaxID=1981099 RepID=A0A255Z795_9PROT|nr:PepSY domain-containing protein [Niveispirillum lacus]OYQ37413.1 hypothetical protein CHU95_01605 [Niveispirillum lacus]
MPYPRLLAGLLLTGSLAAGAYAYAQGAGTGVGAPTVGPATASDTLSLPALLDKLSAQGYRDAHAVERKSDKLVEVKAIGPDGRRQELYVDARTGDVLKVEHD